MIADGPARGAALNPQESFIIQAPAGSGKTELLIQRYLALLGTSVTKPEEIIAITFTRKAASEMRERIISALNGAKNFPKPTEPHKQTTWQLAQTVLQKDTQHCWQLLDNPSRLNLMTIDALALKISRSHPILSKLGAEPQITDQAQSLYQQAAENTLLQFNHPKLKTALTTLLKHLNNHQYLAIQLITNLLAKRDQWLAHLLPLKLDTNQRTRLEAALEHVITQHLNQLKTALPQPLLKEMLDLAHYTQCQKTDIPYESKQTIDNEDFFRDEIQGWLILTELVLTKTDTLRKQVNAKNGFPAPSNTKDKLEKSIRTEMKQRFHELIALLQGQPKAMEVLALTRHLPTAHYPEQQWQLVEALIELLPHAAAELSIVFQQRGVVDFAEVNIAAEQALGTEDNPTDLALALDYQIKHLLIDEFQDTSVSQVRFLQKITAGWQTGDGKTLFLVGDPMQSIYRFREAEVGLFLQCQTNQAFGQVPLTPLQLKVNFRSHPNLIHWFNEAFTAVFPEHQNIELGAVTYSASTSPADANPEHDAVHAYPTILAERDQTISELLQSLRTAQPEASIAVLVRSRPHLNQLLSLLASQNIPFEATEIQSLASYTVIQDLLSLTRALWHLADRTAWLAILRAPFIGLSLNDLTVLAAGATELCLWPALVNHSALALSNDARQILSSVIPILSNALVEKDRASLASVVKATWTALGGPLTLNNHNDLAHAERFFEALEALSEQTPILNYEALLGVVDKLFAKPQQVNSQAIQVMTIHKSKGLEFDHVVIPGLEKRSANDGHELLLWQQTLHDAELNLILAPLQSASDKQDAIYHYLSTLNKKKAYFEAKRLLYVGATRAKSSLHFVANFDTEIDWDNFEPNQNSFLAELWSVLNTQFMQANVNRPLSASISHRTLNPQRRRIPSDYRSQHEVKALKHIRHNQVTLQIDEQQNAIEGTFIHRILQQISLDGLSLWQQKDLTQISKSWQTALLRLGIPSQTLHQAVTKCLTAVKHALTDPKGHWILQQRSILNEAEFAIHTTDQSDERMRIIDRVFIEEDKLWIIDYKTSAPAQDQSLEIFIQEEVNKYRQQLAEYARLLSAMLKRQSNTKLSCSANLANTVHCGLYFPMIPAWHEWTYHEQST